MAGNNSLRQLATQPIVNHSFPAKILVNGSYLAGPQTAYALEGFTALTYLSALLQQLQFALAIDEHVHLIRKS